MLVAPRRYRISLGLSSLTAPGDQFSLIAKKNPVYNEVQADPSRSLPWLGLRMISALYFVVDT